MLIRNYRAVALTILLAGCGAKFHAERYPDPRELAQAAAEAARNGMCSSAEPALRRVLFELPPRDADVADVRFALAECQVDQKAFLEASRQFRRVADDFPSHPRAGEALIRSGGALASLWRRPELDPTFGENAMSTYLEVLSRFPGGEIADSARVEVARLSEEFAEKDFKNAEYYFRIRAYDSAIIYYRHVVQNFPQSNLAPAAMLRLVSIFGRLEYDDERQDSCTYLRRFHPEADGVEDACPAG
jgi:outer membrane protein assembly factor BamD